MSLSLR
jgi:hypothetical protein